MLQQESQEFLQSEEEAIGGLLCVEREEKSFPK